MLLGGVMSDRRMRTGQLFGALLSASLVFGCTTGPAPATSSQSSGAAAAVATTGAVPPTPSTAQKASASAYDKAKADFDTVTVPAAKKEGAITWYTCTTADEAEARMQLFNSVYPEIRVNFLNMQTNEAVEKVTAEGAAGRMVADTYQCGGQSGRTIGWRELADPYTPPTALDPNIKWNFPVMDADGLFPIWMVGLAGVLVNTKLVPADKYPKNWKDLLTDPYWVDLIKKGDALFADPRRPGYGLYLSYGLGSRPEFGEEWIKSFAALKPRLAVTTATMQVERGENAALIGSGVRAAGLKGGAPVDNICPAPGCVTTQFFPVITKGAPHPNAARVWADFWLRKDAQQLLADFGNTPARADIAPMPAFDWATHPQMYWPDDAAERATAKRLQSIVESKVFDY
jgi:iron(III) transport system substrate-binding protein